MKQNCIICLKWFKNVVLHHCQSIQCTQLSAMENDNIVPQNVVMNAVSMNDLIQYNNNESNVNDYTVSNHNNSI